MLHIQSMILWCIQIPFLSLKIILSLCHKYYSNKIYFSQIARALRGNKLDKHKLWKSNKGKKKNFPTKAKAKSDAQRDDRNG